MDKNDAAPVEPERKDVKIKLKSLSATASATKPSVSLDQLSIVINRIDKLVKETRNGVVVAIAVTIVTAIILSLEPWIGLGPLSQPLARLV